MLHGAMLALLGLGALVAVRGTDENAAITDKTSAVCKDYPHLNLCNIQGVLNGALDELEVLLGEDAAADAAKEEMPEKRKSAFVRFGKRKSAFVRFGRSGQAAQEDKRKSSYIRFGRK